MRHAAAFSRQRLETPAVQPDSTRSRLWQLHSIDAAVEFVGVEVLWLNHTFAAFVDVPRIALTSSVMRFTYRKQTNSTIGHGLDAKWTEWTLAQ